MVLWGSRQHPLLLNCPPPRLEAAPCPPDVPLAPEIPSPGGSLHLTRSARLCHYVATDTKPAVNTRWRGSTGNCTGNVRKMVNGVGWTIGMVVLGCIQAVLVVSNSHATDSCLPVEAQKPRLSQRLGQASESRNLRAGAGCAWGGAYGLGCATGELEAPTGWLVTPSRLGHQPGDSKGERNWAMSWATSWAVGWAMSWALLRGTVFSSSSQLFSSNPSFRPSFRRLRVTRSLGLPVVCPVYSPRFK